MKTKPLILIAAILLASAYNLCAATRYVDVNSANPTPPYTNWATVATNIQDALEASVAGDEIVVTNGVYATGERGVWTGDGTTPTRVAVNKALLVRSINGPQFTMVNGGGALRCVYLTNGASFSGFTLTNGSAGVGGGVRCEPANAVVSDCVLTGNSAQWGGGAYGGTLNNCIFT